MQLPHATVNLTSPSSLALDEPILQLLYSNPFTSIPLSVTTLSAVQKANLDEQKILVMRTPTVAPTNIVL